MGGFSIRPSRTDVSAVSAEGAEKHRTLVAAPTVQLDPSGLNSGWSVPHNTIRSIVISLIVSLSRSSIDSISR